MTTRPGLVQQLGALAIVATIVGGCDLFATPFTSTPRAVVERTQLPACGEENATRQDGPWNPAARRCFWEAYQRNQPAEFVSTRLTTEGDPITTIFRVLGPDRVEVFMDTSHDKWSSTRAWIRLDCTSLNAVEPVAAMPDFGPDGSCVETPLTDAGG